MRRNYILQYVKGERERTGRKGGPLLVEGVGRQVRGRPSKQCDEWNAEGRAPQAGVLACRAVGGFTVVQPSNSES